MTRKKYPVNPEDFGVLEEMGYTVEKLTMYQYRIDRGKKKFVDVFPTTRKFCVKNGDIMSKGKSYTNLIEMIENELDEFSKR